MEAGQSAVADLTDHPAVELGQKDAQKFAMGIQCVKGCMLVTSHDRRVADHIAELIAASWRVELRAAVSGGVANRPPCSGSTIAAQLTAQILHGLLGRDDRATSAVQPFNCSRSALASFRSAVSKPSVNQP